MKKILLVIAVFCIARVNAQIVNAGFESWSLDTSYFAGFVGGTIPGDTFSYYDPTGWTSANAITGATSLGGLILAVQSNTPHGGTSAIQLTTDTLETLNVSGLTVKLVVPGLALNGTFPVSGIISQNTLVGGGSISPASVPGAGQPFTQRLASFSGFFQYTPVIDTFTHSNDTCLMWATLRKGSTIVANAQFKSAVNTNGTYTAFTAPFVYLSCETPDTLVVLLASSIPKFAGILSGNTGLVPGSVLLVDDLSYDTLPASTGIVIAANDVDTTSQHTAVTVNVLGNDASCSSLALAVTITTPPANGTAVVTNDSIRYTPANGFLGVDSIFYTDTDPNNVTASAWLKIHVNFNTGISEANEIPVRMFPVPTSNELHVQFENKGKTTAHIYDVVGNLVSVVSLTQNDNSINVANFANGIYGIQLIDESNTVIARGKFAISK